MSQTPPTTLEATARTLHQMYQGIARVLAETRSAARDWSDAGRGRVPDIWVSSEEIARSGIWCCRDPRDLSLQLLVYIARAATGMAKCGSVEARGSPESESAG